MATLSMHLVYTYVTLSPSKTLLSWRKEKRYSLCCRTLSGILMGTNIFIKESTGNAINFCNFFDYKCLNSQNRKRFNSNLLCHILRLGSTVLNFNFWEREHWAHLKPHFELWQSLCGHSMPWMGRWSQGPWQKVSYN